MCLAVNLLSYNFFWEACVCIKNLVGPCHGGQRGCGWLIGENRREETNMEICLMCNWECHVNGCKKVPFYIRVRVFIGNSTSMA